MIKYKVKLELRRPIVNIITWIFVEPLKLEYILVARDDDDDNNNNNINNNTSALA